MCGIIACHTDQPALGYLLPALEHLQYRGYDSVGVAVSDTDGGLALLRSVGRLAELRERIARYHGPTLNGAGIGHTRWATHGAVTEHNAHPHLSCDGSVAVVHNGVIDNAEQLRAQLHDSGHRFASDVDSEVVAHLVEQHRRHGHELADAVSRATAQLSGSWALAVLEPGTNKIVVTARGCPLVVARGEHGLFAASDMSALLRWVETVHVLRDDDVVELGTQWRWSGPDGPRAEAPGITPHWRPEDVLTDGHRDFMAKEIAEQPAVAARIVDDLVPRIEQGTLWASLNLPVPQRVRVLACGTSWHAGLVAARVFERLGGVPARALIASECDDSVVEPGTLTLAISQSGETADVLRALESLDGPVLALTNTMHSGLARRADAAVSCAAGPEIGVAATKTFTAQVITATALALAALAHGGRLAPAELRGHLDALVALPAQLAEADRIAQRHVPALAASLADAPGYLYLGRGAGVPYAREGALKLQELTYRWAHAYPAGELKHGPIALIGAGTPVVAVDDGNPRLRTNLAEVAARGARVIDIGGPGSALPLLDRHAQQPIWGPLPAVLGLQHLARSIALELGCDVDKPRNLAKSVTVE